MILFRDIIAFAHAIQMSADIRTIEHLKQAIDQAEFSEAVTQDLRNLLTKGARALDDRIRSLPGMITIAKSACVYIDIDYEQDFKVCRKVAGSTTEAIFLLMSNMGGIRKDRDDMQISLGDVVGFYLDLSTSNSSSGIKGVKLQVLNQIWETMSPLEIKWFLYFFKSPLPILGIDLEQPYKELAVSIPMQSIRLTIIYATRIGRPNLPRFTDFVLGLDVTDDDRFVQDWVPIGKIIGRPNDDIATVLDTRLADTIAEKFGPTVAFDPTLVLDVTHKGIRQNNRTKAGYVLIEPSIRSILTDNTLADVVKLRDLVGVINKHPRLRSG